MELLYKHVNYTIDRSLYKIRKKLMENKVKDKKFLKWPLYSNSMYYQMRKVGVRFIFPHVDSDTVHFVENVLYKCMLFSFIIKCIFV